MCIFHKFASIIFTLEIFWPYIYNNKKSNGTYIGFVQSFILFEEMNCS